MFDVTACIVLYCNDSDILSKAIDSFLRTDLNVKLYLVDNSPTNQLQTFIKDSRLEYIFNDDNIGFGAGHNIAIKKTIEISSKYHLILNPDIEYKSGTLEQLIDFLNINNNVGLVSPKTLYPNGDIQYLCRMLPTPFDFFAKRFIPNKILPLFKRWMDNYEFRDKDYNKVMEVPFLSGCFMLIRTEAFRKVGLFDENIFMYTEDIDLCRRIFKSYKTIYYPKVSITHGYERGSAKNLKLLYISIKSAIYYFNKWGWFWDNDRVIINRKILNQFK